MKYYRGHKERIGFDFYADIAVRIVQAREEKGMTQKQLSDTMKWTAGKLQGIETVPDMSLYVDASNARTAVLELERNFKRIKARLWSNSRDRAFVQLVGVPVDKNKLKDRFGKYTDNCPLERNPEE